MGGNGLGVFGQGADLSDRFRSMDDFVEWYYIADSWVARTNIERHLSSLGRVTELPQDPVRAGENPDTHDFRHVRYGLHELWAPKGRNKEDRESEASGDAPWAEQSSLPEGVHMIGMEWASCSASPDAFIMKVVRGTLLEPLTTPQDHTKVIGGSFVWSYPDVSDEVWKHKVRPIIEPRLSRLVDKLKIIDWYLT